jgi:hypothetical protein
VRLSELEALRDALGEELDLLDAGEGPLAAGRRKMVLSAA